MTTADRAGATLSAGAAPAPPLLHLRGTEYGLRILGLRMNGPQADEDRSDGAHG
jgi:hypothetical protein